LVSNSKTEAIANLEGFSQRSNLFPSSYALIQSRPVRHPDQ
jgi:hypothetical protein